MLKENQEISFSLLLPMFPINKVSFLISLLNATMEEYIERSAIWLFEYRAKHASCARTPTFSLINGAGLMRTQRDYTSIKTLPKRLRICQYKVKLA